MHPQRTFRDVVFLKSHFIFICFAFAVCAGCGAGSSQKAGGNTSSTLALTTTSLPGAALGATYSFNLSASGGTPPYSWTVVSGQLPAGLSLNSAGEISGTPTSAANSDFKVQVRDSSASPQTASASETIIVGTVAPLAGALSVQVSGDHLINQNGQTIHLIGFGHQGSEYTCLSSTGVRGIFSSTISVDDLRKCIVSVVSGQVWASNRDVNHLLDALSCPPSMRLVDARGAELLSKREADVVRCVSDGLTNREIADQLGLSENTVKNYLFRIFDKLGVSTRVELIMYAIGNLAQQAGPETSKPARALGSPEAAVKQVIASLSLLEEIHRSARSASSNAENVYMWLLVAYDLSTEMQMNIRVAATTLEKELSSRQKLQAERAAERVLRERQDSSPAAPQALPLPKTV